MPDQLRHGTLAAADRIGIPPIALSPTVEAVAEVRKRYGATKPPTRKLQLAEDVECHVAEAAAASGEHAIFEKALVEGELDVMPDTIDLLRKSSPIADATVGDPCLRLGLRDRAHA